MGNYYCKKCGASLVEYHNLPPFQQDCPWLIENKECEHDFHYWGIIPRCLCCLIVAQRKPIGGHERFGSR